jgi:hypothetical protein
MNPQKMDKFFSPLPQRRWRRLCHQAIAIRIEPVEQRGGFSRGERQGMPRQVQARRQEAARVESF